MASTNLNHGLHLPGLGSFLAMSTQAEATNPNPDLYVSLPSCVDSATLHLLCKDTRDRSVRHRRTRLLLFYAGFGSCQFCRRTPAGTIVKKPSEFNHSVREP